MAALYVVDDMLQALYFPTAYSFTYSLPKEPYIPRIWTSKWPLVRAARKVLIFVIVFKVINVKASPCITTLNKDELKMN